MSQNARETWYGGDMFRSALESDWAATLHSLGIEWRYEPKLFTLPSGELYLPDFWLPDIGTWIEVKGDGIPRSEKACELAEMVRCHHGDPGECDCKWFGGQIVLLGRPAGRENGLRHGAMQWDDARYSANLARCGHCGSWSWLRLRISLRCRVCKVLDPESLGMHGTGQVEFHHSDRLGAAEIADPSGKGVR